MNTPTFLVSHSNYSYSRPCFNGAGDTIIFMQCVNGVTPKPWQLFQIPSAGGTATPYYQPDAGTIAATRPDWSSDTGKVAFTGYSIIPGEPGLPSLWIIDGGPNSGAVEAS